MRRDVFQAIADPTRREIIQILARRSLNLNAVAGKFSISRPAISRHMKILHECGLVKIRQQGRERLCEANLRSLADVSNWVEKYRVFWTVKLDALDNFLAGTASPPRQRSQRAGTSRNVKKKKKKT
jgi:DNA-binding transcriptional ArsR family regulator